MAPVRAVEDPGFFNGTEFGDKQSKSEFDIRSLMGYIGLY